ncbi:hypothetical protein HU200_010289 [Digitaria exilis]|uniref:Molybdenum cofactor sulfurase middle domain-containing protein n=1 Tax=Digitaria exilis TaxID=1010633 RepID=A0A835FJ78_9POAL|nr:hypothetical protein HU200_010289 [Digitaria exilis]
MAMEKAASFLSSLIGGARRRRGAGGDGEVHPDIPHQVLQGHRRFRWDRQWVVVNAKGRAYTQRVEPTLALVQVELPPEAFTEDWEPTVDDHMVITAPGMDPLKIPLATEHATVDDVSVWEWSGSAYDEGTDAAEWFSAYFGKPSRLVRFKAESETRPTDPDYAQGYKIMFADLFPFLVASQSLQGTYPVSQFILAAGCIMLVDLVPTINQDNGTFGTEPTETLLTFRSDEVLRPSHKNTRQVYFGQNLVCKESLSGKGNGKIIKVGDPVYVLQAFTSSNEAPAYKYTGGELNKCRASIVLLRTHLTEHETVHRASQEPRPGPAHLPTFQASAPPIHTQPPDRSTSTTCHRPAYRGGDEAMAMEKAASFLSSLIGGGGGGEPAATVKSILIYPIKSCRGIAVAQAPITATGFRWDRQWVVVNGKGRAYTQRVEPKLALVQVELPPEAFTDDWEPTADDHMGILQTSSLCFSSTAIAQLATAADQYAIASNYILKHFSLCYLLRNFLALIELIVQALLIHADQSTIPSNYAPEKVITAPGMDPLKIPLAAERATIDDVSVWEWSGSAYDEGTEAAEWFSAYFGKPSRLVHFKADCFPFLIASQVPTINQDNGILGTEPTETLLTFRSDEVLRPSHKNKRQVYFGQNLVCKESLSGKGKGKIIKVGNPVYVLQAFTSSNEAPA